MDEFTLIERFFKRPAKRQDTVLAGGDDAALLGVPSDQLLVASTDTLVLDIHFYADMQPQDLGHKSLAVNLSDLAAMGAEPAWALLSLTLPEVNEAWLAQFAEGFYALADQFNVDLVGGNIARGPLSVSVTVQGLVTESSALRRAGAKPGDLIFVSGELGNAAGGLLVKQQSLDVPELLNNWLRPEPQVELGRALAGQATAAIDLSDGLLADLSHLLQASQMGAQLEQSQLPISQDLLITFGELQSVELALQGGEDYQLCFTAPASQRERWQSQYGCHIIGVVEQELGIRLHQPDGKLHSCQGRGYQHF